MNHATVNATALATLAHRQSCRPENLCGPCRQRAAKDISDSFTAFVLGPLDVALYVEGAGLSLATESESDSERDRR